MKTYSWLNGDSRKFLKRGYLEGDESPEERIQTIADSAEKYLKIKGFSDKFTAVSYTHLTLPTKRIV